MLGTRKARGHARGQEQKADGQSAGNLCHSQGCCQRCGLCGQLSQVRLVHVRHCTKNNVLFVSAMSVIIIDDVIKATVHGMPAGIQYTSLVTKPHICSDDNAVCSVMLRTHSNNLVFSHTNNIATNLTHKWRLACAASRIQRGWRQHCVRKQAYAKIMPHLLHWAWKPNGPLHKIYIKQQACKRWQT